MYLVLGMPYLDYMQTYDIETSGYTMTVDGAPAERLGHVGGIRCKYVVPDLGIFVLTECDNEYQGATEGLVWENLEDADRPFFMPILGGGTIDGLTNYVVKPYYSNLRDHRNPVIHEQLTPMIEKYGLGGDWGMSQWKLAGSFPIIHDYGFSSEFGGSNIYSCDDRPSFWVEN